LDLSSPTSKGIEGRGKGEKGKGKEREGERDNS